MKRAYRLEGLGCANCASKMETAIGKLPGVNTAVINFMTTKMTLDVEEARLDDILIQAEKIIKGLEPDVKLKRA